MKKLGLLFVVVISLVFTASCVSKEVPMTETYYETELKTENSIDTVNGEDELHPEIDWYCENLIMEQKVVSLPIGSSLEGIWYLGYKLPQHNASKIVIKTVSTTPEARKRALENVFFSYEMVSAYDMTNTEHIAKPPFDKAVYTVYHHFGGEYAHPSRSLYPYQEEEMNEWLDMFNARLANNSELGTQFSCYRRELSPGIGVSVWECDTAEYEFDTTGVRILAIIIAGGGYYGQNEQLALEHASYGFVSSESIEYPWPVISIKLIWSDEVTEQREVPYQVEKQRTIMQTKKVPFWEAFSH